MDKEEKITEDVKSMEPEIKDELTGLRKRLKEKYPDENPEDDAGWDGLGMKYMDEVDAEVGRFKEVEGRMSELCRAYPEFAELVFNMLEHKMPLRVAVAQVFSQEDLIPQDGDDDFESYQKVYKDRLDGASKREEQGREIEENEKKSIETIDAFCEEKGLSDSQKDALIDLINDHFTELLYKRISSEMLEGFLKQMNFDTAVAEADKTGEIRGKNTVIEAKREQERKNMIGDGLPGGIGGGSVEQKPKSVRDFLNEGGSRTNYSELLNKKK